MLRIILGVIVGFIVWSVIWIGSDALLQTLSRDWFGATKDSMALAVANGESYKPDALVVLIDLVRSFVASIMAGFLAAIVAGENRRSPIILGVILLIVGIAVQLQVWNIFPIWFHLVFWISLIPLTILGARMRSN
jgi:hypothetical protein